MTRTPACACAIVVALALPLLPSQTHAASSYENCSGFIDSVPATITTQGVWCLRADLSTALASGYAISVATNNVIIDCNDFKLGGLAAGTGTLASGIGAITRLNLTVRNCNIRGFAVGVRIIGGSGHVVEDSRFDSNRSTGIALEVAGKSVVRRNLVLDTGGGPGFSPYGILVNGGNTVDIHDNTVAGFPTPQPDLWSTGIGVFGQGSIRNNTVGGFAPLGASNSAFGILGGAPGVTIEGNHVSGPGGDSVGISCFNNQSSAARNMTYGFNLGVLSCLQMDNLVNSN